MKKLEPMQVVNMIHAIFAYHAANHDYLINEEQAQVEVDATRKFNEISLDDIVKINDIDPDFVLTINDGFIVSAF